ncbi:hypothetical protein HHK36_017271 [Tetracentron sinense]|uniref:Methyltransferase type 11 domain-containing protein n=1 Tax=Tetracentron sinense TaxID=13715 RepID=A0A835DFK1_TETSI|nr:hypothetical protein HHK36_017271 [Tetracentron sinense]
MYRDVSSCNTYNYGDALYWDTRYVQEAGPFDWYQRFFALRPFVRKFIPSSSSRVLMVGCGNAVMSEDMVKDGYEDIINIDISSVVIDMMRKKYADIPQLKYMQMDVRDMSFFPDESFDSVIDKGTLDSLMCGTDAPISAAQMLGEVSRLLKPGGVYMLITYGDPTVRIPHLNRPVYSWKIILYIICQVWGLLDSLQCIVHHVFREGNVIVDAVAGSRTVSQSSSVCLVPNLWPCIMQLVNIRGTRFVEFQIYKVVKKWGQMLLISDVSVLALVA